MPPVTQTRHDDVGSQHPCCIEEALENAVIVPASTTRVGITYAVAAMVPTRRLNTTMLDS